MVAAAAEGGEAAEEGVGEGAAGDEEGVAVGGVEEVGDTIKAFFFARGGVHF